MQTLREPVLLEGMVLSPVNQNYNYRVLKGGGGPRGGGSLTLMFPKVPQSSLGIPRVPQLPPLLGHPSFGVANTL